MPRKTIITPAHHNFIHQNYLLLSIKSMAKQLPFTAVTISKYMQANNWIVPMEVVKKFTSDKLMRPYTEAEHEYIKANIVIKSIKKIAKELGRSSTTLHRVAHLIGCTAIIEAKAKASRFGKGLIPFNKGKKQNTYMSQEDIARFRAHSYKPGHKTHNDCGADGTIRTRKDKNGTPYQFIRIAKAQWLALATYNWQAVHGRLPPKHVLRHKDGNSMNANIENLQLLSMAENMKLNSINNIPTELQPTIKLINKINKQVKKYGTHKQQ
jgi:HNH endonuclease